MDINIVLNAGKNHAIGTGSAKPTCMAVKLLVGSALLILGLVMAAPETRAAPIELDRTSNKFVQAGARSLKALGPEFAIVGGAAGFIFGEKELDIKELKASLKRQWRNEIRDGREDDFQSFISDKSRGWKRELKTIKIEIDAGNYKRANTDTHKLAGDIGEDLEFFYKAVGEKNPYPAGPTLPYLLSGISMLLDLHINRINWLQKDLDDKIRAGSNKIKQIKLDLATTITDYNKNREEYIKILEMEKERAIDERIAKVKFWRPGEGNGWRAVVRDLGISDEFTRLTWFPPGNLLYYYNCERGYVESGGGPGGASWRDNPCLAKATRWAMVEYTKRIKQLRADVVKINLDYTLSWYPTICAPEKQKPTCFNHVRPQNTILE